MFSLYGQHAAARVEYGNRTGHDRFYQRPMDSNAAKKYRKRLNNNRKARSVSQIDSAVLATAATNAAASSSTAAGAAASTSSTSSAVSSATSRQNLALAGMAAGSVADSAGGAIGGATRLSRKRAPLLRHTSTSLDDLRELKRHLNRPCLLNEEDEDEDEGDDDFDDSGAGIGGGHFGLAMTTMAPDSSMCERRTLGGVVVGSTVCNGGSGSSAGKASPPADTERWMQRSTAVAVAIATPPVSGSPLSTSLESLAKFFSGVFVGGRRSSGTGAANRKSNLPSIRRHYARYDYTALEDEQSTQKMEMEKKQHRGTARGNALLTCQFYIKTSGRYTYLEQLNDIGSRIDKYWFMVRDASLKTDRMMTLVPHSDYSPIGVNGSTKKTLSELFLALQHPYIYPILDVDFKTMAEETFVIIIFPFNCHGSLKDLIYRSNCRDDWQEKYGHRSVGLPESQIQRIGRQILEALVFLQDKGFPTFGHLHSGNVMMQNGVARITGLENTMLGYTSRIFPILKKRLRDCREAIDAICFGHVIFEMAAAYELNVAHPTEKHLQDIQTYTQVLQVLNFIFAREDGKYPTIEEISLLDFFRCLDLREMRGAASQPVLQHKISQSVRNMLKEVRRHQKYQK